MKYIDEYRDQTLSTSYLDSLRTCTSGPWTIMEVCGGQTHTLLKYGIDDALPSNVSLLHGPGCPVCVTPVSLIDKAIALVRSERVILCTFGDMVRVPGSQASLQTIKTREHDVRVVLSPLDALVIAQNNPTREVVFFAIGFETTAPATALTVQIARQRHLTNFSMLVAHMLIPPALALILSNPERTVDAFLAPGHVCTVTGTQDYQALARTYHTPIVVTGFEPVDLLQGIAMCLRQLEQKRNNVEIQYARSVRPEGNRTARALLDQVYEIADQEWRGMGPVAHSGLVLKKQFADFDAERRFKLPEQPVQENEACIMGQVLQGLKKPFECPLFEVHCTPTTPLGAPMVSSEGACAAYYRYKKMS
ncbi:hydrogenase formation protein HypD [bacterium]|nr:hydrogenase formation protein HypD [bacterium]